MLISHKHKFITIDIPKTGTRSLRETLLHFDVLDVVGTPNPQDSFYQHGTISDCELEFVKRGWNIEEYFKFTIVRNPWDRYCSFFKYLKNYASLYEAKDKSIEWNSAEINQGKLSVSLFHGKSDQQVLKKIILNNKAQSDFYNSSMDHIARFENIQHEFDFLCDKIKLNTMTLKHSNKSTRLADSVYNDELVDMVADKEIKVIKLMNFEEPK